MLPGNLFLKNYEKRPLWSTNAIALLKIIEGPVMRISIVTQGHLLMQQWF